MLSYRYFRITDVRVNEISLYYIYRYVYTYNIVRTIALNALYFLVLHYLSVISEEFVNPRLFLNQTLC